MIGLIAKLEDFPLQKDKSHLEYLVYILHL